jgi:hypothetical protein
MPLEANSFLIGAADVGDVGGKIRGAENAIGVTNKRSDSEHASVEDIPQCSSVGSHIAPTEVQVVRACSSPPPPSRKAKAAAMMLEPISKLPAAVDPI